MSDEELDEVLKMIADDYERNRAKGMFGLGGIVGRILTPTVFYGLLTLTLLVIILAVIFKIKQRTPGVAPKDSSK